MITQLNLQAPPARQLQRVTLIELVSPLVATEQYFGLARRHEGESNLCAVVHPYRTAHLYEGAFPILLPLLLPEVGRDLQLSEVTWADIAYTCPDGARPQLLVRTTRLDSAEVIWRERDQSYARSWVTQVWPIIHLLERINPGRHGLDMPIASLPGEDSAAPAHQGSPDGR